MTGFHDLINWSLCFNVFFLATCQPVAYIGFELINQICLESIQRFLRRFDNSLLSWNRMESSRSNRRSMGMEEYRWRMKGKPQQIPAPQTRLSCVWYNIFKQLWASVVQSQRRFGNSPNFELLQFPKSALFPLLYLNTFYFYILTILFFVKSITLVTILQKGSLFMLAGLFLFCFFFFFSLRGLTFLLLSSALLKSRLSTSHLCFLSCSYFLLFAPLYSSSHRALRRWISMLPSWSSSTLSSSSTSPFSLPHASSSCTMEGNIEKYYFSLFPRKVSYLESKNMLDIVDFTID